MPWLVLTRAAHWTTSRPWSSWQSIPVTVHFLEDLERILTSADMDEQGTCIPYMVICDLGLNKNGSPPGP